MLSRRLAGFSSGPGRAEVEPDQVTTLIGTCRSGRDATPRHAINCRGLRTAAVFQSINTCVLGPAPLEFGLSSQYDKRTALIRGQAITDEKAVVAADVGRRIGVLTGGLTTVSTQSAEGPAPHQFLRATPRV